MNNVCFKDNIEYLTYSEHNTKISVVDWWWIITIICNHDASQRDQKFRSRPFYPQVFDVLRWALISYQLDILGNATTHGSVLHYRLTLSRNKREAVLPIYIRKLLGTFLLNGTVGYDKLWHNVIQYQKCSVGPKD